MKFSREANTNLKSDYDGLQEKFDKHMKASNNLYQDLKESFDDQNRTMMRLSVFKEDTEALIAKKDIEMRTAAQKSQEELA